MDAGVGSAGILGLEDSSAQHRNLIPCACPLQLAESGAAAGQLERARESLAVARQRARDEAAAVGRLQDEKVLLLLPIKATGPRSRYVAYPVRALQCICHSLECGARSKGSFQSLCGASKHVALVQAYKTSTELTTLLCGGRRCGCRTA